jgi:hypothetical protein
MFRPKLPVRAIAICGTETTKTDVPNNELMEDEGGTDLMLFDSPYHLGVELSIGCEYHNKYMYGNVTQVLSDPIQFCL